MRERVVSQGVLGNLHSEPWTCRDSYLSSFKLQRLLQQVMFANEAAEDITRQRCIRNRCHLVNVARLEDAKINFTAMRTWNAEKIGSERHTPEGINSAIEIEIIAHLKARRSCKVLDRLAISR